MHRLRRLHDSQYIMKNPFTNENSNLSNIFHNNIHRKKVESLKVRSTEEFLCQFAWLPCRFFRGRRQGRQPLNMYNYVYIYVYQLSRNGMTSIICHDRETMRNDIDMPMVNQDNVWRGSIPLTGIQKPPCAVDQG